MSIIAWIVVGLIAGVLAKMIMPGNRAEPGGWIGTTLLGIVGAVVGGWIWNVAFARAGATGIDLGSIAVSVVGAIVVLAITRMAQRAPV